MNPTIIIGPPGTGKTTAIIERIDKYLVDGTPDRVGYVSFTRRALNVARTRMLNKFGITKDQLRYFRTLHSMCYYLAGITPGQVVDNEHIVSLSVKLGLVLAGTGIKDEGVVESHGADAPLLFHENLARLNKNTIDTHWSNLGICGDVDLDELQRFHADYCLFKRQQNLFDFTDILYAGLDTDPPELDLLLVDEAQDLSPLQWDVVHHLASNSTEVVIAGDANQAIFTWSGADVEYFVGLEGKQQVLGQGYRMAYFPHRAAAKIADRIQVKHNAAFLPRIAIGSVTEIDGIADVLGDGEWLVLARTNLLLAQAKREWKEWHPELKARFSTIHQAKGAESDNVVLMTGMTEKCWRGYQDNPDDELRVWYVGVSRTRENLYVVPSQHARYQFDMEV